MFGKERRFSIHLPECKIQLWPQCEGEQAHRGSAMFLWDPHTGKSSLESPDGTAESPQGMKSLRTLSGKVAANSSCSRATLGGGGGSHKRPACRT